MKLTLQLVVVVVVAITKFRENLLKFTLYTIIIHKVGGIRCHLGRHAPFPTQLAAKQNKDWALYNSNPSRLTWVDLSRDLYIT